MSRKPKNTIEESLLSLRSHLASFSDDEEVTTEKHGIWSIKKLLVLRDYVPPFLGILRNNGYETIHYVDPFAGSGFLRINEKLMPGTPLIPLLTTKEIISFESKLIFDEYHLSDIKKKYVESLQQRMNLLSAGMSTKISIQRKEFTKTIEEIFPGTPPSEKNRKKDAYLVVLDPYGFDVDWMHLARILRSGAVDVLITFPTRQISWNQQKGQSAEALTNMYGNNDWVTFNSEDMFIQKFRQKIENVPVKWKFKTRAISVSAGTMKYHIVCASRSNGALNIFSDMAKKFEKIDTKLLERVFNSTVGDQSTMEQFFD